MAVKFGQKAALNLTFEDGAKIESGLGDKPLYFKNVGLFSENYLQNRLGKSKEPFLLRAWETEDLPAFSALYEWMLSTWSESHLDFENMSEAQLEQEWIRPILERLGWDFIVQPDLKRHGKRQVPDYALFESEGAKKKAQKLEGQSLFDLAAVVADAKAMAVDLDGKAQDNTNPSYQIVQYLTYTNRDWGILTNGRYWRIYSLKSKTKFRSYFEINVEKFLNGTREDSRFKFFFNFFSKNAFAERNAAGQSFVDVVFAEGEQYAREVEAQLKDRAFEIVELIANGFYSSGNFTEGDLQSLYEHSLYYLFRLIFLLNCEAKGLLNISRQNDYYKYSLRNICANIREEAERNQKWSNQPQSYNYIKNLLNMIAQGDSDIGVHGFGQEIFSSGKRKFYDQNSLSDKSLNDVLLRLSCHFDKKKKTWSFIDYQRLSIDHIGSIFEGLLEFRLEKKGSGVDLTNTNGQRKTTGSFYTPEYVVDYIVAETLNPLTEKISNAELLKLRIVDPAMGSGHFLLGVVKFLEEKYLENLNSGDNSSSRIEPSQLRWQILHNCIFGSDINPLAKELAKFSLWMFTAMPGNSLEPLDDQLVCGDSLDIEKTWKPNFKTLEFDAVVGNPPYVRQEHLTSQKLSFEQKYETYHSLADLYAYFVELSTLLTSTTGRVGLIISNKWLKADWGSPMRKWLSSKGVERIIDFGDLQVFKGVAAYPLILIMSKAKSSGKTKVSNIDTLSFQNLDRKVLDCEFDCDIRKLDLAAWQLNDPLSDRILEKAKANSTSLNDFVGKEVYYGIKTGLTEAFVVDSKTYAELVEEDRRSKEILRPFLLGRDIAAYSKPQAKKHLIFLPKGWTKKNMPKGADPWSWFSKTYRGVAGHLAKFRAKAEKRSDMGDFWWEIRACDYYDVFEKPKIMYLAFQVQPQFLLDSTGAISNNATFLIGKEDYLLLGFLNSSLGWFLISQFCTQIQGGYQLIFKNFGKVPFPKSISKGSATKIEKLVQVLCRNGFDEQVCREVDELIFDLYDFSQKERQYLLEFAGRSTKVKKRTAA